MARKLVVCCDGTWNTPRTETNIYQTYQFLSKRLGPTAVETIEDHGMRICRGRDAGGSEVVLYYDEGVGTSWFTRLAGGGLGIGLSDNVQQAYRFLADNYEPASEIYVFGFSRGAFTARSLCGFIKATGGLLVRPSAPDIWRAYVELYATGHGVVARPSGWSLDGVREWLVKKAGETVGHAGRDVATLPRQTGVKIKFIGVYDTVGALGVPLAAAVKVNEPIIGFHDTALGAIVENAVQAMAVDEKRGPYTPTLWTQLPDAAPVAGQRLLQVWFPGVHSDIGGGYLDKGIGNITLDFMMRQAAAAGLVVDPAQHTPALTLQELPAQHDSFDKAWRDLSEELKIIPEAVRIVGPTTVGPRGEALTVATRVCLHPSLVNRIGKRCTTITNQKQDLHREGDYLPLNVKPGVLPLFE
jgi:uncharacterized protein (DUF2235 family)